MQFPPIDTYPEKYQQALERLGIASRQLAAEFLAIWIDGKSVGAEEVRRAPQPVPVLSKPVAPAWRDELAGQILLVLVRNDAEDFVAQHLATRAVMAVDTLIAALAAPATPTRPAAPWPDFEGNTIYLSDHIQFADGATGEVVLCHEASNPWRVLFADGSTGALDPQIGERGRAVVVKP